MSLTPSNMLALGTSAPPFQLPDVVSGKTLTLDDFKTAKALVIMFICNHCPYVKHINQGLVQLANDYIGKGIQFAAISSNDIVSHPDDSPEQMKKTAHELNYPFPYLFDETQNVARAYDAACTPDFYIFNQSKILVYRGQFDDSRPSNQIPVTGKDIRLALDNLIVGKEISAQQRPSIGCNIKWKSVHTV
jgi:peroxiredoxin